MPTDSEPGQELWWWQTGDIVWAGTVANSAALANHQPSISCAEIAPVDCAPQVGVSQNIIAYVTDEDESQPLTVRLKVGNDILDRQTVIGPAHNLAVNFSAVLLPGVHMLTVEVSDGLASDSCSTQVEVSKDVTPPTLIGVPADMEVQASDPQGAIVNFNLPTAWDLCSGTVPVSSSHQPGTKFPVGETTVTFSATDLRGNTAYARMTIRVVQTVQPISWSGVLPPLIDQGIASFRRDRNIQVRFELTGADAGRTDLVAYLTYSRVINGIPGPVINARAPMNGPKDNRFVYNPQTGRYVFTWNTTGLPPGTYQLQIDLGDGIPRTAMVALR